MVLDLGFRIWIYVCIWKNIELFHIYFAVNKSSKESKCLLKLKKDWFFSARQIFSFVFFHFMNRKWLIEFLGHCVRSLKCLQKKSQGFTDSCFVISLGKSQSKFQDTAFLRIEIRIWLISMIKQRLLNRWRRNWTFRCPLKV